MTYFLRTTTIENTFYNDYLNDLLNLKLKLNIQNIEVQLFAISISLGYNIRASPNNIAAPVIAIGL